VPIVTIITINLNNLSGLQNTFQSVISQSNKDFEYIIVDGLSTDGSKEFIESNIEHVDCFVCEKDKSRYDAMNKAIVKAKGDYLLFLNSGDSFYNNGVLQNTVKLLDGTDVVYGDYMFSDGTYKIFPSKLTPYNFYISSLGHQATFFHRGLFEKYGLYDGNFVIGFDREFYMRIFIKGNASYKKTNQFICNFDLTGISNSPKFLAAQSLETKMMFDKYYGKFIDDMEALKEFRFALNRKPYIKKFYKKLKAKLKTIFK